MIAEDNLLVREGVLSLLSGAEDVELVGAFEDLPSVEAGIEALDPDVVITDIRMPPGGRDEGLRLAARLRVDRPEVGVVVLSQYAEPEYVLALLEDGAQGRAYLLKERLFDAGELVRAVTAVAGSGSVIDPKVVEVLVHARRTKDSQLTKLTPREREVLEQFTSGASNKEAGRQLGISPRTIEDHRANIMKKLGAKNAADLVRIVMTAARAS